jgi:sec-independent protein translocase protein TatA
MFGMGWQELTLILFICLLLFGAARLPEMFRSMGKAMSAFKQGMRDGEHEPDTKPPSEPGAKV